MRITGSLVGKLLLVTLAAVVLGFAIGGWLPGGISAAPGYPNRTINIVVGFPAGGGTDLNARALQPILQDILGVPVIVTNMPGASGAIAADYVYKSKPDGYTLLFASEIPAGIFQVMGISKLSFADFTPIMSTAMFIPTISVHPDAPWKTLEELLADARKRPKEITVATAGVATSPHVVALMLEKYAGVKFTLASFAGGGPAITATLGKHVDVTFQSVPEVIEYVRSGKLRALGVLSNQRVDALPDVPAVAEVIPELRPYLPWGWFVTLVAPKDTPEDVVGKLRDAMKAAVEDKRWLDFSNNQCAVRLHLVGDDSMNFIKKWSSFTTWLLYEGGAAKHSPAEFGIPKP